MAGNDAREHREVAGAPGGERLEGVAVRGGDREAGQTEGASPHPRRERCAGNDMTLARLRIDDLAAHPRAG
jgi:hypothetical protein